jgi:N-acetylglucosamine kinase-like BadF-type ATPase
MPERATYVLGIDGGGTKTVCLLANTRGTILGRGEAGPSNYQAVGLEAASEAIDQAIERAFQAAGRLRQRVAVICLGLAGVDRPEDEAIIRGVVTQLGVAEQAIIVNDAVIALWSGTTAGRGVVVIAGTGAIAFGVNARGEQGRAGGWGHLLGDEGSAYDIGRLAMIAALRAYDGRGEPTTLGPLIQQAWGLERLEGLIGRVYGPTLPRPQIAALAPLVVQAAQQGDAVARRILTYAGEELGAVAAAVIRRLDMPGEAFDVVTAGGVFQAGDLIVQPFWRVVTGVAPLARRIVPDAEPAVGAVRLALKMI